MKKFLFFAVAILFSLGLSAQSVSEIAQKKTAILDHYVDLTSEQESEITQINTVRLTEIENNQGNDVAIKQASLARINEIKAALTLTQRAILEAKTGPQSGVRPRY